MKLAQLFEGVQYKCLQGSMEADVTNLAYDNRRIKEKGLFACIKGLTVDGHDFANQAIQAGATALMVQKPIDGISEDITIVHVDEQETGKAMAIIANKFYHEPSKELNMIGITGTNGKTTTTNLVAKIVEMMGEKPGVIGTIENRIGNKRVEAIHTTPQAFELQHLLRDMKNESVDVVSMEVSSHALDLHRVYGTHYNVGVFTNLTLDHLDYHHTMENYLNAKAMLFKMCDKGLFNIDDPHVELLMKDATCKKYTFGIDNDADFKAENVKMSAEGISYTLRYLDEAIEINMAIPGKFSVYNSLAAAGSCYLAGMSWVDIQKGLNAVEGVRGRFETVKSKDGFYAIIDYAHTPDALKNVLETIKEFATNEIITVFGCGGDRDGSKRPVMGEIAGRYSTYCVVTSDNPRTEDPDKIVDQIEPGVIKTGCRYAKIVDRKEGITHALKRAKKSDIILIAGKGHEDYQIIGKTKIHFDDVEVVRDFLEAQ
ncbi:UDP-N-acetylmuramoyl-L-alanyl-D-glutamate--2,6-diaminopimelate ligase [Vallitalea okinawensis]|uniref:UDP-N-acetylmuramoyl-L-alanyl-D-glutamate--2, 6-diaminopimelate ligase n=1 Tax=Vallitalea okinawensis TaxID=2078660 RepID=UPI000CFBC464|nr:UDP-N-acetylmuramoyl-L-alanyl-D-glutamate--2,6-diaminopimelate ligase [Vallitalea okinawensis]